MAHELTIDAVRLALGMQQLRAEVAGANIAHAASPEFLPQRVDFTAAADWLDRVAAGFKPAGGAPDVRALAPVIADASATHVQTDEQVAEMVEASLQFQALSESLNRHFGLMRLAISGRSA